MHKDSASIILMVKDKEPCCKCLQYINVQGKVSFTMRTDEDENQHFVHKSFFHLKRINPENCSKVTSGHPPENCRLPPSLPKSPKQKTLTLGAGFRMPRHIILDVIDLIRDDIEPQTSRSHAIPATLQTLCALRYYGTGNFQTVGGDIAGISQPSVSRIVARVSTAFSRKATQIIRFPRAQNEQQQIMAGFYESIQFPNTLRCVDGSLIRIKCPSVDEHVYVCRTNFHSLNIQGICDNNKKFTNLVARWPGSAHDTFIWNNCKLSEDFENGNIHGYLLGDSAYPLRPWLLTPIANPQNAAEDRYNRHHRQTRQQIEGTFGIWKLRWLCLHAYGGALMFTPDRCVRVITATAVLHNIY
ncbi:putative nuclease HARBI1 [Gigantopelta aegis]|uniref:putative nuclease HARBI1 n=1 Tax=Gigantopelta aegis TaxID=1735272 RepID=UPI001B88A61D|nr:putative nuclease HARBI1 [Gigantopelta aegis]